MPGAIIVHGGAGKIPPDVVEHYSVGCKEAALIGWDILQAGGSALDAVEAAVRLLEDNPYYNAGTGASPTADGKIELDAGMMDGRTLEVGAVADVELIKNPISLARKVLESPHVLLVGRGAQQFAQEQGITLCKAEDLMIGPRYERWLAERSQLTQYIPAGTSSPQDADMVQGPPDKHGTVGAVALDWSGSLAAATSTGGIPNKYPGRVGDSPLVGCGFYADENAAISCTGDGEDFIRLLIARRAADFVARGDRARDAAEAAIAVLGAKAKGVGGLIVVDRLGNVGFAWNSQTMAYAYMIEGMDEPIAGV